MNSQNKAIAIVAIRFFVAGLWTGNIATHALLNTALPVPLAPTIIAFGSSVSAAACIALALVMLARTWHPLALIPIALAGMAPSFCVLVLAMSSVVSDDFLRAITIGITALAISVSPVLIALPKRLASRHAIKLATAREGNHVY